MFISSRPRLGRRQFFRAGCAGIFIAWAPALARAANVNNVRTIANACPRPVVVRYRDGSGRERVFTINANQSWTGEMWVPWANSESGFKNHYIEIDATSGTALPTAANAKYFPRIRIFQTGSDIWFAGDNGSGMGDWQGAKVMSGGKGMGDSSGERALKLSRSVIDQLIVTIS